MKKIHIGLLPRIIIAILLGIAVGHFFPASLVRIFVTFNGIFSEFHLSFWGSSPLPLPTLAKKPVKCCLSLH